MHLNMMAPSATFSQVFNLILNEENYKIIPKHPIQGKGIAVICLTEVEVFNQFTYMNLKHG